MKALPEDVAAAAEVNARFEAEVERFAFRFRCPSCAHFAFAAASCSLGFPNAMLTGAVRAIEPHGELVFCKYFELGEDDGGN
ncbi:MAG: hypothetical protein R3F39_23325 [Myxococcota bacterium]